ncbi:hypothetical protein GCM10025857_57040 [Alicyclobacillus contaminans]|nr:hypothetical protein GCM10025857_57040 [Alicyclobacillus contaminans]
MSAVVDTVKDMVMPILEENNFELVDLEFVKEGKNWYLRVFIDKEGGIDIEECAYVSEYLSEKLDNADPDPIPQAYFLEVSSPGAERPLKMKKIIKKQWEIISMFLYMNQSIIKNNMMVFYNL